MNGRACLKTNREDRAGLGMNRESGWADLGNVGDCSYAGLGWDGGGWGWAVI